MTAVLAIDAAWTATEPSGVALVSSTASRWRCVAATASYDAFIGLAAGLPSSWTASFTGQAPDVSRLLSAAQHLVGAPVDLVAIDMPIATVPITGRRAADNAISKTFGGRGCSAHTPNSIRPGPLGATLSEGFVAAGFPIATTTTVAAAPQHLLEVYPHPALLSLLRRDYRVPYKMSKTLCYWPALSLEQRIHSLLTEFGVIHDALCAVFGSLGVPLPPAGSVRTLSELKRYEDALDALVCAWVGVRYLQGGTVALGDGTAAIWCPHDVISSPTRRGERSGT
jgi:predicted RNase H-like nuclease